MLCVGGPVLTPGGVVLRLLLLLLTPSLSWCYRRSLWGATAGWRWRWGWDTSGTRLRTPPYCQWIPEVRTAVMPAAIPVGPLCWSTWAAGLDAYGVVLGGGHLTSRYAGCGYGLCPGVAVGCSLGLGSGWGRVGVVAGAVAWWGPRYGGVDPGDGPMTRWPR